MIKFFIIVLLIVGLFKIFQNKLILRFDTLFRKGFKRYSDKLFGVYCFCGKQGDGKTYSVIDYLYETKKGKKIITNVKSFADNNKEFVIYNDNFYDIIGKFNDGTYTNNYIIFYDEIFTLLEKGKLGKDILSFISQLRKRKIILVTTAQEWLEINVTFRRYVRYQIDCKMFDLPIFNCSLSINSINNGYEMKWDNLQNEYVSPRIKTTIKKCSKKYADSYDTFETISVTR